MGQQADEPKRQTADKEQLVAFQHLKQTLAQQQQEVELQAAKPSVSMAATATAAVDASLAAVTPDTHFAASKEVSTPPLHRIASPKKKKAIFSHLSLSDSQASPSLDSLLQILADTPTSSANLQVPTTSSSYLGASSSEETKSKLAAEAADSSSSLSSSDSDSDEYFSEIESAKQFYEKRRREERKEVLSFDLSHKLQSLLSIADSTPDDTADYHHIQPTKAHTSLARSRLSVEREQPTPSPPASLRYPQPTSTATTSQVFPAQFYSAAIPTDTVGLKQKSFDSPRKTESFKATTNLIPGPTTPTLSSPFSSLSTDSKRDWSPKTPTNRFSPSLSNTEFDHTPINEMSLGSFDDPFITPTVDEPKSQRYSLKTLVEMKNAKALPPDLDPEALETALTDEEFLLRLEMPRHEFNKLKKWRQIKLRRELGL